jgi:hypothetical protein
MQFRFAFKRYESGSHKRMQEGKPAWRSRLLFGRRFADCVLKNPTLIGVRSRAGI